MSDPQIKIEEVTAAESSDWSVQLNSATTGNGNGNGSGNVLRWPNSALPYTLRSMRAQAEIYAITRALEEAGWNRKRAAQMLRISYRGLLYKISSHKITRAAAKMQLVSAEAALSFAGNFAGSEIK
jgi:DNA-binding NtrC family response regulator